ncbi:MAG TPA: 50S ribosomal protein L17 [Candidatus Paceibacterota bacterium]
MRKFHRKKGPRRLFTKILAHNLVMNGKIETTDARAREVRPIVERLVTIAKGQNLPSLRRLYTKLPKVSANKLYYETAPKFKERKGGYLRIVKTAHHRRRDGVSTAIVEFVQ